MNRDPFVPKVAVETSLMKLLELCVCDCSMMWRKKMSGGEWYCGKGQDVWSILNIECFQSASISMAAGLFFCCWSYRDESSNKQNEGCWTVIMSSAILSLIARSAEFDLVSSLHITEEISLCISLCEKVTVIISSVKAECVTPISCVGTWCPLKQSQAVAYFHTKIIHVKIQLAISCSHAICINFRSEWLLQYLRGLAPLPCQFCTELSFSVYFWGTGV